MKVSKKIALSLALLLSLQVSALADSTRVEQYHNKKQQQVKSPSSSRHMYTNRPSHKQQNVRQEYRQSKRYSNVRDRQVRPVNRPYVERRIVRPQRIIPQNRRVGHRVNTLHRDAYRFRHAGLNYRYRSGVFYRPYTHGYRVVSAPIGALILTLPIGYSTLSYNHQNYYHYNDVYYRQDRGVHGYRGVERPYIAPQPSRY